MSISLADHGTHGKPEVGSEIALCETLPECGCGRQNHA
jgi:hypothetical protein